MKKYDKKFCRQLENEGLSPGDAALVASAEMKGAHESGRSGLNARQTACPVLHYNETLPQSEGQREGRIACLTAINNSLEAQEWLKNNREKLR